MLLFVFLFIVYTFRTTANLFASSFLQNDERRAIESFFAGVIRRFPGGKYAE